MGLIERFKKYFSPESAPSPLVNATFPTPGPRARPDAERDERSVSDLLDCVERAGADELDKLSQLLLAKWESSWRNRRELAEAVGVAVFNRYSSLPDRAEKDWAHMIRLHFQIASYYPSGARALAVTVADGSPKVFSFLDGIEHLPEFTKAGIKAALIPVLTAMLTDERWNKERPCDELGSVAWALYSLGAGPEITSRPEFIRQWKEYWRKLHHINYVGMRIDGAYGIKPDDTKYVWAPKLPHERV